MTRYDDRGSWFGVATVKLKLMSNDRSKFPKHAIGNFDWRCDELQQFLVEAQ